MPINPLNSDESIRNIEMEADMPPSTQSDTENKLGSTEKKKKKHIYVWRVVSFTSCSKSCGGGTLTPIIRCVKDGTTKFYAHKRCAHQTKPSLNENVLKCNVQPCPAYWKVNEWSACNCGLPNENDYQTREIKCVQELASGVVIHVNEGACLEKQPEIRQECNCPKQQVALYRSQHKRNHHEKGHKHHNHPSAITLIGNSTIGKKAHVLDNKKTGIWLSSDWTEQVISSFSMNQSNFDSIFQNIFSVQPNVAKEHSIDQYSVIDPQRRVKDVTSKSHQIQLNHVQKQHVVMSVIGFWVHGVNVLVIASI